MTGEPTKNGSGDGNGELDHALAAIVEFAAEVAGRLPAGSPLLADAEEVRRKAERASDLARRLRALGAGAPPCPDVPSLDLNALLAEMTPLIRRTAGAGVEVALAMAAGLGRVRAEPGRMAQAIVNLAGVARDAMPHGGRLSIETKELPESEPRADGRPPLPGPHVRLSVSDTGPGAASSAGLEVVREIVERYGGHARRLGSTSEVWLPREGTKTQAAEHAEHAENTESIVSANSASSAAKPQSPPPGTQATILVAEDEDDLRAIVERALARNGYSVVSARDGVEALEAAAGVRAPLDLLVTDISMPRMGGVELARRLRQARPGTLVLYMSGSTPSVAVPDILTGRGAFLPKPFTAAALAEKVRELLGLPPEEGWERWS